MNSIITELIEINNGWDYSSLSKLAQNHGGPRQLIKKIAFDNHIIGFGEGFTYGKTSVLRVVIPVAVLAIAAVGVWGYCKCKKQKETDLELSILLKENAKIKASIYADKLLSEHEVEDMNKPEDKVEED